METLTGSFVEWHVASAPYLDNSETGDAGFVRLQDGVALAVAVDALGHGSEAALVAEAAERWLKQADAGTLESVMEGCHQALRGMRGAAICLARLDANRDELSWLSVGNIQGVRIGLDSAGVPQYESLVMRGGVVGDRLPELRASWAALKPGDMLILATDGIGFSWHSEFRPGISAAELADALLRKHAHGNDDAMVLAVRYKAGEEHALE